jgi:hypothetical protein
MNDNSDREGRIARSLRRLDHRLVRCPGGGFATAELSGKIVAGETDFAKSFTLDDVKAWIKDYIRPKPRRRA